MSTINCGGNLLNLSTPVVMGIVNCTPDSFYDGGKAMKIDDALRQSEQMIKEGASIIDVGGYSSRPDGKDISPDEETDRVVHVIEAISQRFDVALSCQWV